MSLRVYNVGSIYENDLIITQATSEIIINDSDLDPIFKTFDCEEDKNAVRIVLENDSDEYLEFDIKIVFDKLPSIVKFKDTVGFVSSTGTSLFYSLSFIPHSIHTIEFCLIDKEKIRIYVYVNNKLKTSFLV